MAELVKIAEDQQIDIVVSQKPYVVRGKVLGLGGYIIVAGEVPKVGVWVRENNETRRRNSHIIATYLSPATGTEMFYDVAVTSLNIQDSFSDHRLIVYTVNWGNVNGYSVFWRPWYVHKCENWELFNRIILDELDEISPIEDLHERARTITRAVQNTIEWAPRRQQGSSCTGGCMKIWSTSKRP
ncbi:hypothetical protein PR048_002124 [Dryococelus australis]|uniref:Endonuclease/exonuclease/phosphatase domain-containing protein n=1 Tax=Dryococelus australis TaxID=614101 RepID=A0ABQ9IJA0_9NEOP|nr:hypothetical protein PR048_002124 [Dryococelus australis]